MLETGTIFQMRRRSQISAGRDQLYASMSFATRNVPHVFEVLPTPEACTQHPKQRPSISLAQGTETDAINTHSFHCDTKFRHAIRGIGEGETTVRDFLSSDNLSDFPLSPFQHPNILIH